MTTKPVEMNGPWRINAQRQVFDNPWVTVVDHDVTHPDGSTGEYGVVSFKNLAIGILPIDEEGFTWLVGQHRFPLKQYSWELPEGGGPLGEAPLTSAKRELAEETGLVAGSWEELSSFAVSNSVTDERAVCFLAWDLKQGAPKPEGSEALTIRRVSFSALLEMVMSGEITDSLTIVMVLTAYIKALRGAAPAPISKHILEVSRQA